MVQAGGWGCQRLGARLWPRRWLAGRTGTGVADRVPARPVFWRADLPAARPAGRARAPAGLPQTRRPTAQGQGCGRRAGHQPEHGAQGLPRAGDQGPHGRATRPGHVHPGHPPPGGAARAGWAPAFPARLARHRRYGRAGRRRDRGAVYQRAAGISRPRRGGRRDGGRGVNVIEASGLGQRYGSTWGLRQCTLAIPEGHVAALVGPNGAGKTTLLNLAVGLWVPTAGTVTVLGGTRPGSPAALDGIAFVAQDAPLYANLSVADTLHLTRNLNRRFDLGYAQARLGELGIPLTRQAGPLSRGEQGPLALTLAPGRRAPAL